MAKWLDRMINGGFIAIPIVIALLIFLLGRLGCSTHSIKEVESAVESPAVLTQQAETYQSTLVEK